MPDGFVPIKCSNKIHIFCNHNDIFDGTLVSTDTPMSTVAGTQTYNYVCVFCGTEYAQLAETDMPGFKKSVCADGVHDDDKKDFDITKEKFDECEDKRIRKNIPIKKLGNEKEFKTQYLHYYGKSKLEKLERDEQEKEEQEKEEQEKQERGKSKQSESNYLQQQMLIQRKLRQLKRKHEQERLHESNKKRGLGKIKKQRTRTKPKSKNKSRMGRSPHKPKKQRTRTKPKPKKQRTRTKPKPKN
tara:strand:+ start:304 stop:1032 length:729 start_codon:yes stop_codon:yes gene_type:complete